MSLDWDDVKEMTLGNWERSFLADEVTETLGGETEGQCVWWPRGRKESYIRPIYETLLSVSLRRLHFIVTAVESHWEGQLRL